MSTKQIEMLQEQVDAILINDLQETLEMQLDWGAEGEWTPNFELVHALKTVLAHYMSVDDFSEYCKSLIKRQEKAARKK